MDTLSSSRSLRLEAYPFDWQQLTERQRTAVQTVSELLLYGLDALDQRKVDSTDPIDRDRRSQMAFVDGDRGTGKTSVLLAVRNCTRVEKLDKVPEVVRSLNERRHRFVWLETLDMEPLPRTANLLAAILARISEQLEYPSRRIPTRLSAAFDELDEHERIASDLQELEVDAVLAWQGIEPRRAERTDPTVFAAEVLKSERAGLRLNPRLDGVLNGLAKLLGPLGLQNPMFIIPVDDFDLAATRCLELLRIIRIVTTARLFFLVAGNTRVAETVLRLQSEGELAALSGSTVAGIEMRALSSCAIEIAANNMRKLVPPEQRIRLEEIRVGEALRFRDSPERPTLEERLESVSFERNNAGPGKGHTSLKSFLLFADPLPPELYSGVLWLGGKPRQVLDRAAMFARYGGELQNWGEGLLRDLAEDLMRETREQGHLELDQRELLFELLDTTFTVRFNFQRTLRLSVETGLRRVVKFTGGIAHLRHPGASEWRFRDNRETVKSDAPYDPVERRLPKGLGAGITVLHDLAVSLWGGYCFPNSIHYQPEGYFEHVEVDWSETRDVPSPVQWYAPEWWTLREFERFAAHWLAHAQSCSTLDDHAEGWLAALLEVLMDEPHEPRSSLSAARLERLFTQLVKEQPTRYARRYLRESALVVVTLLLAPESGCGESLAHLLASDQSAFFGALHDELALRVRTWRAGTFAIALNHAKAREVPIGAQTMRLLSAVSPSAAIEEAYDQLDRISARYQLEKEAAPLRGLLNEREERTKAGDQLGSKDALKILRRCRKSLPAGDLATVGEAAIVALEDAYANHPINELGQGRLVPPRSEISRRINMRDPRRRRSP